MLLEFKNRGYILAFKPDVSTLSLILDNVRECVYTLSALKTTEQFN